MNDPDTEGHKCLRSRDSYVHGLHLHHIVLIEAILLRISSEVISVRLVPSEAVHGSKGNIADFVHGSKYIT